MGWAPAPCRQSWVRPEHSPNPGSEARGSKGILSLALLRAAPCLPAALCLCLDSVQMLPACPYRALIVWEP